MDNICRASNCMGSLCLSRNSVAMRYIHYNRQENVVLSYVFVHMITFISLKHKTQDETDGPVGEHILGHGGRQIMQDKLPEIGTHEKIPFVPKWQP